MGDRVRVNVTVLAGQKKDAYEILVAECGEPDDEIHYQNFTEFSFEEVNYANLRCEYKLTEAGIAYDKDWAQGGEFSAGVEYARFSETGDYFIIALDDGGENPDIGSLWDRLNNYTDLVDYIKSHRNKTTPKPWNNQIEYGKRYMARKLISSG